MIWRKGTCLMGEPNQPSQHRWDQTMPSSPSRLLQPSEVEGDWGSHVGGVVQAIKQPRPQNHWLTGVHGKENYGVVSCNNQYKPNLGEQRLGPQLHQLLHHGLVHQLDVRPVRKVMNARVHFQPPWVQNAEPGPEASEVCSCYLVCRNILWKSLKGKSSPNKFPAWYLVIPPRKNFGKFLYNKSAGRSSRKKSQHLGDW